MAPHGGSRGRANRPRKTPLQARSRLTYDRIVDVASRILRDEGYDAFSMNRLTRDAGVSPGTLYQYFPNREAVTLEVFERSVDELAMGLFAQYVSLLGKPFDIVVRSIVESALDRVDAHGRLWRAVMTEIPRRELLARVSSISERASDLTRAHMAMQPDRTPGDEGLTIWMAVSAGEALVTRYVIDPPPGSREEFVDEVVRMTKVLAASRG